MSGTPTVPEIDKEVEFQQRRVAGMQRYIAQCELELAGMAEIRLVLEKLLKETKINLEKEQGYLDWLEESRREEQEAEEHA